MEGAEFEHNPIVSFLLPEESHICEKNNNSMQDNKGFMAGDIRVNENPGKVIKILGEIYNDPDDSNDSNY